MRKNFLTLVQGILLRPREEWTRIKEEPLSVSQIFTSYVLILAAVPPVTRFLANLLYGQFIRPFSGWSWTVAGRDLLFSVITYVFSLLVVFISGRLICSLAPIFSSNQNRVNAMKLAILSMTPFWIGGLLYLVPQAGWILKLLFSFYGIYILYLGITAALMDTPQKKVVGYSITSSLLIIVLIVGVEIILKVLFAVWGVSRIG